MLKKEITYKDFDGNEKTKTFFFNMTKAELTEVELSYKDGLVKTMQDAVDRDDKPRIMEIFKSLLLGAYGEKSLDGERFIKTPEVREAFMQTQAFSDLYMELVTEPEKVQTFILGIMPQELREQVQKQLEQKNLSN